MPNKASLIIVLLSNIMLQVGGGTRFNDYYIAHLDNLTANVLHRRLVVQRLRPTFGRLFDLLRTRHRYPDRGFRPYACTSDVHRPRSNSCHSFSPSQLTVSCRSLRPPTTLHLCINDCGQYHIRSGLPSQLSVPDPPGTYHNRLRVHILDVQQAILHRSTDSGHPPQNHARGLARPGSGSGIQPGTLCWRSFVRGLLGISRGALTNLHLAGSKSASRIRSLTDTRHPPGSWLLSGPSSGSR